MSSVAREQLDLLPHSLGAEAAVLGSVLLDPDAIGRTREVGLEAGHFFRETNRWIYAAMLTLADRFDAITMQTVADILENREAGKDNQLGAIGGPAELTRLMLDLSSSVHAGHYADIVVRTATQRRVIAASGEIAAMAQRWDGTTDELFDAASQVFFKAVDVQGKASHLYGTDDALMDYLTGQQERADRLARNPNAQIKTGLPGLDYLLGDLPGGTIHLVAAKTSVGKTTYMETMAEWNAQRAHSVAFYHLELTHQTMLDRRMARHSKIQVNQLRKGYSGVEVARATDAIRKWQERVTYIHCPGWSAGRIAADIVRLRSRGQCDLAFVDYLQRMPLGDDRGMNQATLIGGQVLTLSACANVLDIPIVLGSQVSRASNQSDTKRPTMEHIRNSGMPAEFANQIVILHRPTAVEMREQGAKQELIEAYVEKNTTGQGGRVDLVHLLGQFLLGEPVIDEDDQRRF